MKLEKKKLLAARALKIGKGRIILDSERLNEIKEAITKQDIIDLYKSGTIKIREKKGRKKIEKRKTRRGKGKIKKLVKKRKQTYVIITRKLRSYIKELKKQGKIDREIYYEIRKKIKARDFANKAQLKEYLKEGEKKPQREKLK